MIIDHFTADCDIPACARHDTVKAICEAVSIPVIAIGGISKDNVGQLSGLGLDGIAVISAIYASDDLKSATEDLKAKTVAALGL